LALIRAFCAPARPSTRLIEASGAIIFTCVKRRRAAVVARVKLGESETSSVFGSRQNKNYDSEEVPNSWAFLRRADFRAKNSSRKIFFAAASCLRSLRALTADVGRGSYTQNQVESLLFFFLCSNPVIVPVDSRRHCKLSPSTQARRAAMAKKRKAKAKAPKKAKRRKKK
jgi:hypothetical protein